MNIPFFFNFLRKNIIRKILILDAFNTTKAKQIQSLSALNQTQKYLNVVSGIYNNTGAIDSIGFRNSSVATWNSICRFSLYGIKVA